MMGAAHASTSSASSGSSGTEREMPSSSHASWMQAIQTCSSLKTTQLVGLGYAQTVHQSVTISGTALPHFLTINASLAFALQPQDDISLGPGRVLGWVNNEVVTHVDTVLATFEHPAERDRAYELVAALVVSRAYCCPAYALLACLVDDQLLSGSVHGLNPIERKFKSGVIST